MTQGKTVAECYFLDVGQGTSNVILLGQRRAIVIDCGPSGRIPLLLLRRHVDHIVALIVSHNDRDHHGGASGIIAAYPNAIDRVFFLQDRPIERVALYGLVKRALQEGTMLAEPVRLERDDALRVLFADPERDLSLELLFPSFRDNLDAQARTQPNETSAVLVLFCGKRRIVFPGDCPVEEWRRIRQRLGCPLRADILSVPHHGGNIAERRRSSESPGQYESRVQADLRWLYSDGIPCRLAIVSVGTANDYGHPNEACVTALRSTGADVVCTQITPRCHDTLESLRPGVIPPDSPSQSRRAHDVTQGGRSRNVACAGTVVSEIGPETVRIRRFDEHQRAVDSLSGSPAGHPLCRN